MLGVIQAKAAPICPSELSVELVPVDMLVADVSHLSQEVKHLAVSISKNMSGDPKRVEIHGFNYIHPDRGTVSFRNTFRWLKDFLEQCGRPLQPVAFAEWQTLIESVGDDNSLFPIRNKISGMLQTYITKEYPIDWSDISLDRSSTVTQKTMENYFAFIHSSILPTLSK